LAREIALSWVNFVNFAGNSNSPSVRPKPGEHFGHRIALTAVDFDSGTQVCSVCALQPRPMCREWLVRKLSIGVTLIDQFGEICCATEKLL
jgi:hypothetical protein